MFKPKVASCLRKNSGHPHAGWHHAAIIDQLPYKSLPPPTVRQVVRPVRSVSQGAQPMSMQLSADVALRAALRIRINPPNRQSVPEITRDTGITAQASDHWRSQWQRQGQLLPASSMPTEQCSAAGRLAAV